MGNSPFPNSFAASGAVYIVRDEFKLRKPGGASGMAQPREPTGKKVGRMGDQVTGDRLIMRLVGGWGHRQSIEIASLLLLLLIYLSFSLNKIHYQLNKCPARVTRGPCRRTAATRSRCLRRVTKPEPSFICPTYNTSRGLEFTSSFQKILRRTDMPSLGEVKKRQKEQSV